MSSKQLAAGLTIALVTGLIAYSLYKAEEKKKSREATASRESRHSLSISALTVYPIKSCKGISLSSSIVTSKGLAYDRVYMLIDCGKEINRFVTQRQYPRLSQVITAIDYNTGVLTISAEGIDSRVSIDLASHACISTTGHGEDSDMDALDMQRLAL